MGYKPKGATRFSSVSIREPTLRTGAGHSQK